MDSDMNRTGFQQTVLSGLRRQHRISMGLRMTPMIDVIFLLLTFFVLTAKFQDTEQRLPVFVGKTTPDAAIAVDTPLAIYVQPGSDGYRITAADHPAITMMPQQPQEALLMLARHVQQTLETSTSGAIEVYYDDDVPWDVVVKVYDVLYALGTDNITFRIDE